MTERRPRLLLSRLVVSLLVVGSVSYFASWSPNCDAWRSKAYAKLAKINTLGPNSERARERSLEEIDPGPPIGCDI